MNNQTYIDDAITSLVTRCEAVAQNQAFARVLSDGLENNAGRVSIDAESLSNYLHNIAELLDDIRSDLMTADTHYPK